MSASRTAVRERPSRRKTLSTSMSFWAASAIAFLAFAANAAASPLYPLYQAEFGFSTTTLTLLFAVYTAVVLLTLLFFGSVSDYLGRRLVMLAGLAAGAAACCLFLIAHSLELLFAARALQGVAVGLISGTASAALHDLRSEGRAATVVSSAAPTGGQALGALGASVLAQYALAPTHLVWWLLLAAFVIGAVAVLASAEPGTVRVGVASSLRPRVGVPRGARSAFVEAVPGLVGVWALGGFYLTLGPSLAAQLLDSRNLLWGGILIFLLTGVAGAASTLLGKRSASGVLLGGCLALIVGALLTLTAIETDMQAVLFLGTAVTGLGFGPAFMGAYRVTIALAPPNDRASLIAAIYIVSYLATGIPAVVGGIATSQYGLHKTALVYLAAVAALAVVAVIPLIRRMASKTAIRGNNQPDAPPGAGTVPPCPPIEPRLAEAKA
jgi:MFS family permease